MSTRSEIERVLTQWDERRQLLRHPTKGMAAKGFRSDQVDLAARECDKMIQHYEQLLEQF